MSTQIAPHTPRVPAWTFGDRLRKARHVAGMDQRAFADSIGATASQVASWETDRSTPRDQVAVALRVELLTGIPATWVLGLDATNPRPGGGPDGGGVLPRLDSNQQPSGSPNTQVSASTLDELAAHRSRRRQGADEVRKVA